MKLTWQQIPSPIISEILCNNSLDGVVIDTEHSTFNLETLLSCIQVVTLCGKKCFVRLTEINKTMVRLCLDSGCTGLIFSTVESLDQAELVKQYSLYPCQGGKRGLGLVRQNSWGLKDLISEKPILIAQIESVEGVKNIQSIWKDSEIFDYCMIGPYDLSASAGKPGDFESKAFKHLIEEVRSIVPEDRMAVHIPNNVEKELKKYENCNDQKQTNQSKSS